MRNPEDRTPAVRSLSRAWRDSCGILVFPREYDALEIYQVPDNITAAAFSFSVSQTGRVKDS